MSETQQTVQQETVPAGEGYTGFEVNASFGDKVGQTLISHSTKVVYVFGREVGSVDLVEPHSKAAALAHELAKREVENRVAAFRQETGATVAPTPPAPQPAAPAAPAQAPAPVPAPQQQAAPAPAPAPQAAPADGDPRQGVGQRPNGKGQIRFFTTAQLSSDDFKARIGQALQALGEDPAEFVIYDERTGNRGLESGGENFSTASVKPVDGTLAAEQAAMKTQRGGTKTAYYVDMEADGSVSLSASKDYKSVKAAIDMARQMQGGQQPPAVPPPGDEDVPF